ncbi:hypothetical protein [Paenibacillus agaridevorans]|uniref:hypothetical protein n=1 Tax=Paenibacillus agaridevorans TaxID=171404 RepID=UPI001BE4505D|nr:hypothetical protein [Paenibacillus agaridevorans]
MAEKRMISKVISISKKFNLQLTDHFSRLLYLLLIPHSDDFGRLTGDPFKVKGLILPMMKEVDEEDVEKTLGNLHKAGLINWYESNGEKYVQIINFDDHQQGLHKRTRSKFPEPPELSRNFPEIPSEQNRTELKGTEEKGTEQNPVCDPNFVLNLLNRYRVEYSGVFSIEQVESYLPMMDSEVLEHCIKLSEGKHTSYAVKILDRHIKEGKTKKESIRHLHPVPNTKNDHGESEARTAARIADSYTPEYGKYEPTADLGVK